MGGEGFDAHGSSIQEATRSDLVPLGRAGAPREWRRILGGQAHDSDRLHVACESIVVRLQVLNHIAKTTRCKTVGFRGTGSVYARVQSSVYCVVNILELAKY